MKEIKKESEVKKVLLKMVKVSGYILVSLFIMLVANVAFWQILEEKLPIEYYGLINIVLVALAEVLKRKIPENKVVKAL